MSELEWDWRTWLRKHPRCTACNESILEEKIIKVFSKPYHTECWERLTKK